MKKFVKFFSIFTLIGIFLAISLIHRLLSLTLISFRRRSLKINRLFSRLMLRILDIHVDWAIGPNFLSKKNYYIVSNHLSYLDVLILNSRLPSCFVTSQEIRETPGLGLISLLAGCVFVERRNKLKIRNEVSEITQVLKNGLNVFVFPEATSTNGERVLPFKKSLFQASINGETSILPVTLNYLSIDNAPVNLSNRDSLFWYGDMEFLSHLLNVCENKNIRCRVTINNPIDVSKNLNLAILSEIAWDRVATNYVPKIAGKSNDADILLTTHSFTL